MQERNPPGGGANLGYSAAFVEFGQILHAGEGPSGGACSIRMEGKRGGGGI